MKQGISPAVAVVVILVVVIVVVLIGWQVFLKKPSGKGEGPKSPEEMKALMQEKMMHTAPKQGAQKGMGPGMMKPGGAPPGGG